MSYFKAIMHQIEFRPPLREFTAPPELLAGFKGPASKGEDGKGQAMRHEGYGGKRRGPQWLVHIPMFEILRNTLRT